MKLKIAITTVAIAMSSQAYAATDTSCNPFARGASCNGVALGAAFGGSTFGDFMARHRARGPVISALREMQASSSAGSLAQAFAASIIGDAALATAPGELEEVLSEDLVTDLDEVDGGDEELSAVPVPAAGFLLLAGLGGLVAMRRKQS